MTSVPSARPLRPELEPLPARLSTLPVDARGYPVPWFVAWVDGQPDFRIADGDKWRRAVRESRCWICGGRLGRWLTFVIGPMCAINRTTTEPPAHTDCARYAARNCPFLVRPQMVRREDETVNADVHMREGAGTPLLRNPGVALLWTTHSFNVFHDRAGKPLIHVGKAEQVEWYAGGRRATRAEVAASIDSGLPLLREVAAQQGPEALRELDRAWAAVLPLYPSETPRELSHASESGHS
jgi:hypothetical protein